MTGTDSEDEGTELAWRGVRVCEGHDGTHSAEWELKLIPR